MGGSPDGRRAVRDEDAFDAARADAWLKERLDGPTGTPEVIGPFRLAVIAQQTYHRYHHGQTRNPAFRNLWPAVNYLNWRCRRVIARAGR